MQTVITLIVFLFSVAAASLSVVRLKQVERLLSNKEINIDLLVRLGVSPTVAKYIAEGDRLSAVKAYIGGSNLGIKEASAYIKQMSKQINR